MIVLLFLLVAPVWAAPPEQQISALHRAALDDVTHQRYAAAEQKANEALRIAVGSYGNGDRRLIPCLETLYDVHVGSNNRKEAETDRKRVIALIVGYFGPNHFQVAEEKLRLASFYSLDERWKECNALYEECIPVFLKARQIPLASASMGDYARLLRVQGKVADAERWEARAAELERHPLR